MELFAPFLVQVHVGFRAIHTFFLATVNHYLSLARDDLSLFSQIIEVIRSSPLETHHILTTIREIAQTIIQARVDKDSPFFRGLGLFILLTFYAMFVISHMHPTAPKGSLRRYADEKHAAMWRPFLTLFCFWICSFGVNLACVQRRIWWVTGVMRIAGQEQAVVRAVSAYRFFGWALAILAFAVETEETGLSEWIQVPGELTYEMEYGRLMRFYGKAHADEWAVDCVRLRNIFRRNHPELTVAAAELEGQLKDEEQPRVKVCHTCGSPRSKGLGMV